MRSPKLIDHIAYEVADIEEAYAEAKRLGLAIKKDIERLEADIKATKDNKNGFAKGDWVPYLSIEFVLTKDGKEVAKGPFMPMVANDGPHYGDNVKLAGNGKYELTLKVASPAANPHAHFGRHVDKETGVGPWFAPFELKYDFVYTGTGKKGGY